MKTPLSTLLAPLRLLKKLYMAEFFVIFVIVGILAGYFSLNATSTNRNKPLVFQGRLTDNSYVPLSDGSTAYLRFAFYDASTAGNCLWATGTDTATGLNNCTGGSGSARGIAATVTRGIFSVSIGDTSVSNMPALPLDFNPANLFIGVTACTAADSGCDAEMTPRVRVGAAAYAYNADEIDGRDSSQILLANETLTLPAVTSAAQTATTTTITFGAHTNRTVGELIDFDINMNRTVTFTTGADIATQRAMRIQPPTYNGSAATQAITNAATLAITGGPADGGANITIARPIGLWLQGDNMVDGNFLRISYPNATTLQTLITGVQISFNSNLTVSSTANQTVNGEQILLPAVTNTSAGITKTITGASIQGDTQTANNATAVITWNGINITMPTATQTAGTINTAGLYISGAGEAGNIYAAIQTTENAGAVALGGATPSTTYQVDIADTNTAVNSAGLRVTHSGAVAGAGYAISGIKTGASTANVAGYFSATGGTSNYGLIVAGGDVGIGDVTPNAPLDLLSSTAASTTALILTHTNGNDPVINFEVAEGTATFSLGVDNSETGDPFKISTTGLGTSDFFTIDPRMDTSSVVMASIGHNTSGPTHGTGIATAGGTAEYTTFSVVPPSIILSGTTQTTSQMDTILLRQPSISNGSASTVDDAALLTLEGAPAGGGGGPATITDSYALKINTATAAGTTRTYGLYIDAMTGGAGTHYAAAFATGNVGILTVTPNEALDVNGSIGVLRTGTAATTYTATATDYYIGMTAAGARTLNLPTAASITGRVYIIKDEAGTAGASNITIDPSGAETIDGGATAPINANYGFRTVISDGTNWMVISRE